MGLASEYIMQLAALMYFNQFVSLSFKKKNQTPQKELTFYSKGKKKKKKGKKYWFRNIFEMPGSMELQAQISG